MATDSGATSVGYDSSDNLTTYVTSTLSLSALYDAEKHPVSFDAPAGNLAHLVYDALGRRVAEDQGGTLTYYVWDDSQIVGHAGLGAPVSLDVPGDGIDAHIA